jgi:GNAT superfamily N-acetyltransferase
MTSFTIEPIDASPVADAALERLLHETFVDDGFTEPSLAAAAFAATAVRARGTVLVAHDSLGEALGTITLVPGGSAARRLAEDGEAELHLLCVRRTARGSGIGRALVEAALDVARRSGVVRVLLWTQPAMQAAQRLYEGFGFRREPAHDFTRGERRFLVYACALSGPVTPEPADARPA